MDIKFRRELRQGLVENFTLEELRTLCFDLSINWDELRGDTLSSKSQAIIIHLENRGQLAELIAVLQEERPHTTWPALPSMPTKPESSQATIPSSADQETALQNYLKEMRTLLLEHKLKASELEDDVRKIATTLTFSTLENVDGQRKGAVLKFLYEMGLVTPLEPEQPLWDAAVDLNSKFFKPVIYLDGANLTQAQLPGADLQKINLAGANLQQANFSSANLFDAVFIGAILSGANLSFANLQQTKSLAQFSLGNQFQRFRSSHLFMAKLDGANLKEAKLDLTDLAEAATIANVILPDGRRYPDTTSMSYLIDE